MQQLAAEGQWQGNYGVTWAQSVCRRPPSWKGVFPLISPTQGEAPSANGRLKFITGVSAASMLQWIACCKKVLTGAAGHQRVMKRKGNSWRTQTERSTGEKTENWSSAGVEQNCSHCSVASGCVSISHICLCVALVEEKACVWELRTLKCMKFSHADWLDHCSLWQLLKWKPSWNRYLSQMIMWTIQKIMIRLRHVDKTTITVRIHFMFLFSWQAVPWQEWMSESSEHVAV